MEHDTVPDVGAAGGAGSEYGAGSANSPRSHHLLPAVEGGTPVRARCLPYARQSVTAADLRLVAEALQSDWLTTGPRVAEFERRFAAYTGAPQAVAVSSGTAALHASLACLGIGPGDEVLVPSLSFAASANCALYVGARPVFVDVDPDTLLIDARDAARKLSPRTRALVAVDLAGQPCDYAVLIELCRAAGLKLVADACHSLGGADEGQRVGTLADATAFSFHPVKHITTAEGGLVACADLELARRVRVFRSHGIESEPLGREREGAWYYEVRSLGYNYRISDLHCALGLSQLARAADLLARRRGIAARYQRAFAEQPGLRPLALRPGASHAWHLYIVQLELERMRVDRAQIFRALRAEGIGVQVHYIPLHLHPYYRERLGTAPGDCPAAETAYQRSLSLPLFPGMSERDVDDVIAAVRKVIGHYLA